MQIVVCQPSHSKLDRIVSGFSFLDLKAQSPGLYLSYLQSLVKGLETLVTGSPRLRVLTVDYTFLVKSQLASKNNF